MISIALSLALATSAIVSDPLDSLVTVLSKHELPQLRKEMSTTKDLARAVAGFFIAAQDTSARIAASREAFADARTGTASPVRSALLGASEAISAREAGANRLEAARWIGRALDDLDAAVASDSTNPTIRVIRINALARVPEMFRVDARIAADRSVLLAHSRGNLEKADASIVMAMAAASHRAGDENEARRLWKLVADRGSGERFLASQAARSLQPTTK